MYADILSSVLNDWVDELNGEALIDFAQVCRAQMLESARDSAAVALAAELSYDRALLKVCEAHGIATSTLPIHSAQGRTLAARTGADRHRHRSRVLTELLAGGLKLSL